MQKRILLLLVSVLVLLSSHLKAQDAYFSQYYASPLTLNPSLAGLFDGNYRINGVYRDQWRGSQLNPFTTFTAGVDMRFDLVNQFGKYKDGVGVGVTFLRDIAGVYQLGTTGMQISAAYHKSLFMNSAQYLSVGFSSAVIQRSLNIGRLDFQDSFNGINAFDRQTLEDIPANNFSYLDHNIGINYAFAPRKALGYGVGISIAHITRPQQSFHKRDGTIPETEATLIPDANLPMRLALHGNLVIPVNNNVEISPRILLMNQRGFYLAQAGSNFRFTLDKDQRNAFHLGGWLRVNNQLGRPAPSDIGMLIGYQIDTFILGLSYDYNLLKISSLKTPGTFELSVTYFGTYENNSGLCPVF